MIEGDAADSAKDGAHGRRGWILAVALVGLIAAAVRFSLLARSPGGLTGDFGYDPGVYYASADALIHGRLPYSDFTMLHPPGLMLVLTPFAALGVLTTDHLGFVAGNLAFELLGAVNAVLVVVAGRRYGLTRGPALIAGLVYATWFSAVEPETIIRLEPLGTFAFIVGLVVLGRDGGRLRLLLGGVAIGMAVSVKIWWIVPVLVVLAWRLPRSSRRDLVPIVGGIVAIWVLVNGPFFVVAPRAMFRMIISDQLGRPHLGATKQRLLSLTAVTVCRGGTTLMVLAVILAFVLALLALRVPRMRMIVALAAAQVVVLMASPSFFPDYSGLVAACFALVVGGAAAQVNGLPGRAVGSLALACAVTTAVFPLSTGQPGLSYRFPRYAISNAAAHVRCVMSDAPGGLILADVLSRDLARGCPNWIDVTGRTYDVDKSPGSTYVPRARRAVWQRDLRAYLGSGQLVILMRQTTGIGPGIKAWLASKKLVVHRRGVRAWRVDLPRKSSAHG